MGAREYLSFTKRERNGIVALLVIMLAVAFVPKYLCKPKLLAEKISTEAYDQLLKKQENTDTTKFKARENFAGKNKKFEPPKYVRKKIEPLEINAADTTAFIALPGIGSKLAQRIVTFREKLGGFYDVSQVGEVYGLRDSVFRKILPYLKCNAGSIQKININSAGKEVLKAHPYIRWSMANAMLTYRDQHGSFNNIVDLATIESIDQEDLKKVIPYISFK
jgi:DNA uptake protein ComE-like DNA-binding protein